MVHHKIQAALNKKSEHAMRALLMRLWLISSGKARKRIQRMIMQGSKMPKKKRKSKKSGHPQRKKGKRKMTKEEARKHFKKILPKINAGRKAKGLKPIRMK